MDIRTRLKTLYNVHNGRIIEFKITKIHDGGLEQYHDVSRDVTKINSMLKDKLIRIGLLTKTGKIPKI